MSYGSYGDDRPVPSAPPMAFYASPVDERFLGFLTNPDTEIVQAIPVALPVAPPRSEDSLARRAPITRRERARNLLWSGSLTQVSLFEAGALPAICMIADLGLHALEEALKAGGSTGDSLAGRLFATPSAVSSALSIETGVESIYAFVHAQRALALTTKGRREEEFALRTYGIDKEIFDVLRSGQKHYLSLISECLSYASAMGAGWLLPDPQMALTGIGCMASSGFFDFLSGWLDAKKLDVLKEKFPQFAETVEYISEHVSKRLTTKALYAAVGSLVMALGTGVFWGWLNNWDKEHHKDLSNPHEIFAAISGALTMCGFSFIGTARRFQVPEFIAHLVQSKTDEATRSPDLEVARRELAETAQRIGFNDATFRERVIPRSAYEQAIALIEKVCLAMGLAAVRVLGVEKGLPVMIGIMVIAATLRGMAQWRYNSWEPVRERMANPALAEAHALAVSEQHGRWLDPRSRATFFGGPGDLLRAPLLEDGSETTALVPGGRR